MKFTKFYSLDECLDKDKVIQMLDKLADDRKIDYDYVDSDLIKIKDLSLSIKETKDLSKFLSDNDVLEDFDFEDEDDDSDDDFNEYDSEDY